jgi:hypothetical protein
MQPHLQVPSSCNVVTINLLLNCCQDCGVVQACGYSTTNKKDQGEQCW